MHRLRHQSNATAPVARSGGAPNSQIVDYSRFPYILCEINVSSVYPFPDDALGPLVAATLAQIERLR